MAELQLNTTAQCTKTCDDMGYICAGYSVDVTSQKCEIVPRGYGLSNDASYDFYRKKTDPTRVNYKKWTGSAIPSYIYEWYATNGTLATVQDLCTPDSRCAGFYMCTTGKEEANCGHLKITATAVLLAGVPAPKLLLANSDSIVYAKEQAATVEGNAEGATCSFPFQASGTTDDFYECSIANSER